MQSNEHSYRPRFLMTPSHQEGRGLFGDMADSEAGGEPAREESEVPGA